MADPWKDWKADHPDMEDTWVLRTLVNPDRHIVDPEDGRGLYYRWEKEADDWIKVVVDSDRQVTAYRDHQVRPQWGRPS